MKMTLNLSKRDRLIIANALALCPAAELGDRIGGNDGNTTKRRIKLAEMFDWDTAREMEMLLSPPFNRSRA